MALRDEILGGQHDSELAVIEQAIHTRKRYIFRPGVKVRLHGARDAALDGKEGTVLRVNPKRIGVGIGERGEFGYEREYNIPISMLEVIA